MQEKLYKVVRESRYNGGGSSQLQGTEVLYCGYDRKEAIRTYHANQSTGHNVPGHYYTTVRCLSKLVTVG
jgi:hypothetical protein